MNNNHSRYLIRKSNNKDGNFISRQTFFCVPHGTLDVIQPLDASLQFKCKLNNNLKNYLKKVNIYTQLYEEKGVFNEFLENQELFNKFFLEYMNGTSSNLIRFLNGEAESNSNVLNHYLPDQIKNVVTKMKPNK